MSLQNGACSVEVPRSNSTSLTLPSHFPHTSHSPNPFVFLSFYSTRCCWVFFPPNLRRGACVCAYVRHVFDFSLLADMIGAVRCDNAHHAATGKSGTFHITCYNLASENMPFWKVAIFGNAGRWRSILTPIQPPPPQHHPNPTPNNTPLPPPKVTWV